jgi:hypothetical protein
MQVGQIFSSFGPKIPSFPFRYKRQETPPDTIFENQWPIFIIIKEYFVINNKLQRYILEYTFHWNVRKFL